VRPSDGALGPWPVAARYNSWMAPNETSLPDRYLRYRRSWEIALWTLAGVVTVVANSIVATIDLNRHRHPFDWWEPWSWELSSVVVLLALVPAQLLFDRRFPIRAGTWRRALPWHLLATVPYSLVHVVAMVGLRHVMYDAMGGEYDFGSWPGELWYEYLKDVRTYAFLLGFIYLYRLILLRVQGEARLLTAPDTGPPVEAIERPTRFLVRKVGAEFLVAARDIEWLEAAENYVNLHVRGRAYPLRSTMTAIQERLDPQRFVRVHRSYIVNLDFLVQIDPTDAGDAQLLLKDGTRIPCSRRYRQALRDELAGALSSAGEI
jgi:hypothetical protein